mmetsp:Transcript_120592/g.352231  ORF Transcript_120592/g.352231 Transcript_120592/m.352231 type:complete len:298 (+) Transcript_120592:337-1230(+)
MAAAPRLAPRARPNAPPRHAPMKSDGANTPPTSPEAWEMTVAESLRNTSSSSEAAESRPTWLSRPRAPSRGPRDHWLAEGSSGSTVSASTSLIALKPSKSTRPEQAEEINTMKMLPTMGMMFEGTPLSVSIATVPLAACCALPNPYETQPMAMPSPMNARSSTFPPSQANCRDETSPRPGPPLAKVRTTAALSAAARSRVVRSRLFSPVGLTTSEAKKMPAMGALKPAATPAAAPEASTESGFMDRRLAEPWERPPAAKKESRSTVQSVQSVCATTVAARGALKSTASSPMSCPSSL